MVFLVLALGVTEVNAQEHTVKGIITAQEDGSVLPGASVSVKGSSVGTVTDAHGSYKVSIPGTGSVLRFSFLGYVTQEITVGSQTIIDVVLVSNARALSEVVVTGYTTQQKKDLTSAVAVISPADLLSVPATSVEQQLQGRAAGVTVVNSNVPGEGANVRIRGIGTLGNNDPLYIIDGVPTKDNLANFNQNDIESIQILKDATSASIYGSRAGNGVVIITTKKGKWGEPRVTLDAYYGIQSPHRFPELLNTQQYGDYQWALKRNAGDITNGNPQHPQYGNGPAPVIPDYIVPSGAFEGDPHVAPDKYSFAHYLPDGTANPDFNVNVFPIARANKQGTNWLGEILAPAPIQNYQLGVSGASERARYAISVGHFNQRGILKYNGFKRYTLRANTDFTIKNRIRVGENFQALFAQRQGTFANQNEESQINGASRMQPIIPVYDIKGNFAGNIGQGFGDDTNPLASLWRSRENGYQEVRFFGNTYLEADILKDLTVRTSFGIDASIRRGRYATAPAPENAGLMGIYGYTADFNYRYSWTWTNTVNYKLHVADAHNFQINLGTEAISAYGEYQSGARSHYLTFDPVFTGLTSLPG